MRDVEVVGRPTVRIYAQVSSEIADQIDLRRDALGISRSDVVAMALVRQFGDEVQVSRLREVSL